MDAEMWEFCQLVEQGVASTKHGNRYHVTLHFAGWETKSVTIASLGDKSKSWTVDPFRLVMGRLGRLGWEVVSVQHADTGGGMHASGNATELLWQRRVAYFKRRVTEGRAIDDVLAYLDA